ncbi:MAG: Gfo/Idh/MocA family oxidoreductase [Alphaproteobacteria bacterium]
MSPQPVRIGMLGAGFIGQMHALTFSTVRYSRFPDRVPVALVALAESDAALAREVAARYDWQRTTPDWHDVVADPGIDLFINAGPNDRHAEPTIAAAAAGKALFSEKPLARDADEAHRIWQAAADAQVLHMCAFLHRSIPALRLARQMIEAGELGTLRHFRSNFLMDMVQPGEVLTWRFDRKAAGGGASSDLGSHHIDVCRFLAGEPVEVQASAKSWRKDSAGRVAAVNDDWVAAIARLDNDATAVFEATRSDEPHSLTGRIEVDGNKGSVLFDVERLNELQWREPGKSPRIIKALAPGHPYAEFWLPGGIQGSHAVGWNDCFVFQAHQMLTAMAEKRPLDPMAATFEDGYRVAEIVDAILRSADGGAREAVRHRGLR